MNLIDHLHSTVTPKVLSLIHHHEGDELAKRSALSEFFAIFGGRLSDPNVLARVRNLSLDDVQEGNRVLETIFQDDEGHSQTAALSDELAKAHHLPKETVNAITATSAPLVYEELTSLAGTRSLPAFLQDNMGSLVTHLPDWAQKLLPLGLLTGAAGFINTAKANLNKDISVVDTVNAATTKTEIAQHVADDGQAHPHQEPIATHINDQVQPIQPEASGFAKSLLPIIGLIIFAGLAWLLLRSCQEKPTPVAAPVAVTSPNEQTNNASINAAPATFSLATDDKGEGIYSCRGEAGGEGVFASIRTALSGVFGVADDKCNLNVVSGMADTLPASEHLAGIFGLMKGVPNASVSITDKVIRFNAANPDDVKKLIDNTKALVPADFVVEAEPVLDVASAVTNSISTAKTAITELTDTATADDLVRALNLQIINFATASSEIPAENKEILDLAASKLAQLPDVKLSIIGHTDSQGSHASNKTLSEQRAKAVHDYLVSKGVPDDRLETFGASFDEPVATNATEQGRFQNRRIEFALTKDGEPIASVGSQTPTATNSSLPAQSGQ